VIDENTSTSGQVNRLWLWDLLNAKGIRSTKMKQTQILLWNLETNIAERVWKVIMAGIL
jgi:hypothetical protein